MDAGLDVDPRLHRALVSWAARHAVSVSAVLERAVAEYLLDVDAGLLTPPDREYRSLAGRGVTSRGYRYR